MKKTLKSLCRNPLILLFSFIFLNGCVSYSGFHNKKSKFSNYFVEPVKSKILSYKVLDWKIGKAMKETVSRGIKIDFSLPVLKSKDLKILNQEKGVDSIIVKVVQNMGHRVMILGFLEIPLYRELRTLRSGGKAYGRKFKQPEKAHFSIEYIAATINSRGHQMICPPHHHNLVITKVKTREFITKRDKQLSFSSKYEGYITSTTRKFLVQSQIFRGWKSLIGKYYLELAYFDSKKKKRLTNFYRLNNYIEVVDEKEVKVSSCPESRTPFNGIRYKGKPFQWKRKSFF